MIKINKTLFELDQMAKEFFDALIKSPFEISKKLNKRINESENYSLEKKFFKLIKKHLEQIIVSQPNVLHELIDTIKPIYDKILNKYISIGIDQDDKKNLKSNFLADINNIFDYNKFVKIQKGKYAYEHSLRLGVSVCLYCNRQYVFTILGSKKIRPQFDHFYNKSTFPFFALSFYNLIPCCSICNSNLKRSSSFSYINNLHPFLEGFEGILKFDIDVSATDFIEGNKKSFSISLKKVKDQEREYTKALTNAQEFIITDIYSTHKDYVEEIIKKAYYYNKSRINEIYNFKSPIGNKIFNSKEEVIEFILGNFVSTNKLGDRVLAKITKDISEKLGMHKII